MGFSRIIPRGRRKAGHPNPCFCFFGCPCLSAPFYPVDARGGLVSFTSVNCFPCLVCVGVRVFSFAPCFFAVLAKLWSEIGPEHRFVAG